MDFLERLKDNIDGATSKEPAITIGYLSPKSDSFCIYPIPGSRVIQKYYDGAKDQELNYEIAMKQTGKGINEINTILWLVSTHLEELSELTSLDGSFDFESVEITNKPFINSLDDNKTYIFMLDIQAKITTYPKGE